MTRALALAALLLAGCGRGVISAPTALPLASTSPPPIVSLPPPNPMSGWFVTGRGAPAAAGNNVLIVIPSWGDNSRAVADALVAQNAWAIVSAHHVFGNPQATWERDWKRTKEWFAPIEKTGRLAGIYVIDEPFGGEIPGITAAWIEAAVSRVAHDGYRTMVAETVDAYHVHGEWRPSVDWFGVTAYYDPFFQKTVPLYQSDSNLDVVFGTSRDPERWRNLAAETHKHVFLWSFDLGAAKHTWRIGS